MEDYITLYPSTRLHLLIQKTFREANLLKSVLQPLQNMKMSLKLYGSRWASRLTGHFNMKPLILWFSEYRKNPLSNF